LAIGDSQAMLMAMLVLWMLHQAQADLLARDIPSGKTHITSGNKLRARGSIALVLIVLFFCKDVSCS